MEQKIKGSDLPVAAKKTGLFIIGFETSPKKSVKVPVEMVYEDGTLKSEEYSTVNYKEI